MTRPYLLISLTVILTIFYLLTYILTKLNIIKVITHRKIWNVLLFLTFIVTGVLGIILVIQVNYKLEIPLIKEILVWHVDFAIAMCIIAIFHLTWHWNYYKNIIFSKKEQKETITEPDISQLEYKAGQKETSVKIESTMKLPKVVIGILVG